MNQQRPQRELDDKLNQDDEMELEENKEPDKKIGFQQKLSEILKVPVTREDEEEAEKIVVNWGEGPRLKKICKNGKWFVAYCGPAGTIVQPLAKFAQGLAGLYTESERKDLEEEDDDTEAFPILTEYID